MANARVSRGRKTQQLLAGWFRSHGWVGAESRPASLPGSDVYGMPGLAPEVKATAGQDLTGALRQAKRNASATCVFHGKNVPVPLDEDITCTCDLAFVIYRPNGYGPEKIGQWLVAFSLEDATQLLKEAGY